MSPTVYVKPVVCEDMSNCTQKQEGSDSDKAAVPQNGSSMGHFLDSTPKKPTSVGGTPTRASTPSSQLSENCHDAVTRRLFELQSTEETPACKCHELVIDKLFKGRIGLRLHKKSLRVIDVVEPEAQGTWHVGDRIIAVEGRAVESYEDWLSSMAGVVGTDCVSPPIVITIERSSADADDVAAKATAGMAGGVLGGALFGLTCVTLAGGGWVAVAAVSAVPLYFGAVGGSVVGAGRETTETAFSSGVVAGFVGPTVTTVFLGGERLSVAGDSPAADDSPEADV